MAYSVNKNRIAKNTIALYIRMGVTMVIGFFTTRIMLQQLGSEDYGLNNLVGSIVSLMSFINGSMGTAVQRFYSIEIGKEDNNRLKKVFSVGLYLHIIVSLITFVLAEFFAIFFLSKLNIPSDRLLAAHVVFQVSVLTMVLNIVSVPFTALLRAREKFSEMAYWDITQAVLRLGVLFLLTIFSYDKLISLSFLNLGITVIYISAMVIMAHKFTESHQSPGRYPELIKQMMSFVSMMLLTVLLQVVNTKGLVLLINVFFGLLVNAAYAIAVQVQNLVNTFVLSFKQAIVPQMMSSYGAGDISTMHKLIDFGTKATFLLMLMISLPIIFEANFLLCIWLKEPPQYAAEMVVLTVIAINVTSFTYFQYQGVHATGDVTGQQVWTSISYVLGILITLLLFLLGFSFYYALIISILIGVTQCFINVYFAVKKYNYNYKSFLVLTLRCAACAIISSIILLIVNKVMPDGWLRLAVISVSTLVCTGILGLYSIFESSERQRIYSLIPLLSNKI